MEPLGVLGTPCMLSRSEAVATAPGSGETTPPSCTPTCRRGWLWRPIEQNVGEVLQLGHHNLNTSCVLAMALGIATTLQPRVQLVH